MASSTLDRFAAIAGAVEQRFANRAVERVLRSPAHPLLSWRFLLISYEGHRTGRRYTTPVAYWSRPEGVVLLTPREQTTWWTNFRGGHDLRVLLRGSWREGRGEVVADEAAVAAHLRHVAHLPRAVTKTALGRPIPGDARLREAAPGFVLVEVSL